MQPLSFNYVMTPQEHVWIGSGIDDRYFEQPYVPLAIQDGHPIEDVGSFRARRHQFWPMAVGFVDTSGNEQGDKAVAFPPLDPETGETLHDPRPIREGITVVVSNNERFFIRE